MLRRESLRTDAVVIGRTRSRRAKAGAVCCLLFLLIGTTALADAVKVRIEGIDGAVRDNVRASVSLVALAERTDLSEAAIRRLHRRAGDQIRRAMQAFGYYQSQVERRLQRQNENSWLATYTVEPGPVVVIGKVNIQINGDGRDERAIAETLKANRLRSGAPLRHSQYTLLKSSLRRAALDQGYLDARFTVHQMLVDTAAGHADITLTLDTGAQFRFGAIVIDQDAVSDSLVRRYLDFSEGDPFNQDKLLDTQYALQDSGYYSIVSVSAERDKADNQSVPISINAAARKRQRYSTGIGYASDVGPRVSLAWENRRINVRGHRANADLRVSEPRTEVSTRYIVPFNDPRTDRYILSLAHLSEDLGEDTTSRRQQLRLTQTRVLGQWQRNLYSEITREVTSIGTQTSDLLLLPGASFTRTRSDTPVQPRRASRVTADIRGSQTALGANTDFLSLRLEGRLIRPLGKGRVLVRTDIGLAAVDEFDALPASQRFFAGGDRSVRGFGFNELGQRDAMGRNIGGRYLLATSLELDWPIAGRWSAAVFVDGGNAFNSFGDELEYSVGVGGRLRTPVGVVRLDLAKPVTVGRPVRLHIGLGPDL